MSIFTRRQRMAFCGRTITHRNQKVTYVENSDQGISNGILFDTIDVIQSPALLL